MLDLDGVLAKAEHRQRAGAFKFRGAFNRLSLIPESERGRGVVAVSSGNHGAAVSLAGELLGIPVTVFTPEDAPRTKRELMETHGASIETFPRSIPDREAPARDRAAETGATFVHPFEDPEVMAGAGTTGLELHGQVGPLDVVYVPMSGGGLMAGCASALSVLDPGCRLVGVEPVTADDTRRSFAAGHPVTVANPQTVADGLAVPAPGERTLSINLQLVSEVVTVSEREIVGAMRKLAVEHGEVVEPSGAASYAASLRDGRGSRMAVVLSGGNVDQTEFPEVFSR